MKKTAYTALLLLLLTALALTNSCGKEGPDAPPDLLPPTIVSTSPYYNEANVPLNAVIKVTFNEAMSGGSINNQTVALLLGSAPVNGTVGASGANALFTPEILLEPNSTYWVSITTGVKDFSGNAMVAPFVFSFATGTTLAAETFTVTPSAGEHGAISPAAAQTVVSRATATFIISADAGYHVVTPVGGTCGGTLSGNQLTTNPITADCTVIAAFAADGAATHIVTASAGPNGSLSPSGAASVGHGATASYTITPNAGYSAVTPVGGTCGGSLSGSTYTTNAVNNDCTVTASFAANAVVTHTITASAGPNGSLSPSGAVSVNHGARRTFTITPNTGYHVITPVGGTCGGSLSGSTYTTNVVNNDCTVAASFAANAPEPPVTHKITASADSNGEIIPSGAVSVIHGASQSFEIKTDGIFVISSIEVDGHDIDIPRLAKSFTYTFINVDRDHKITARFKRIWQIDASFEGNGSISPSGLVDVEEGASQSFAMTHGADSFIAGVFVDGYNVGHVSQYLFPNVTSNHSIWVSFARLTPVAYMVTATAVGGGSIDPAAATVTDGATRQFALIPDNERFRVVTPIGGTCGGILSETTLTYTTGPITSDCTVVATFQASTVTVTPDGGENGELTPADAQQVNYNGTVSFTLTPAPGYAIGSASGCGGTLTGDRFTTGPVTADCTVTATFVPSMAI